MFGIQWSRYDNGALPAAAPVGTVAEMYWITAAALPLTLLPLLFPTGRPPSRRWNWLGWTSALGMTTIVVSFSAWLWPHRDTLVRGEEIAGDLDGSFALVAAFGLLLLLIGLIGSMISLVVRFRRARGIERQQLKWVGLGVAIPAVLIAIDQFGVVSSMGIFTSLPIPVAIGFAMLRYRLYDIDRLINRALVYGLLTLILLGAYFALVLGVGALLQDMSGNSSSLVVAGSTLTVAALFRPIRGRTQAFVDRRFYRNTYDAARVVEGFAERLRDEVDLATLGVELQAAVRETMQPAHVSLWLRPATWAER
jgi:hypothetical protein